MSDDNDKTVFRQPAVPSDRTVMRPTPGKRAGSTTQLRQPPQSPQPPPAAPREQPGYRQSEPVPRHAFDTEAAYFKTTRGLNPLVNAASTILAVFQKTRQSLSHPDVGGLHQRLVNEVKTFEARAREQGVQPEIALAARYVLCSVLDEAVVNTPWGSESSWTQHTLLSVFHNETSGGEKFFMILDRMRQAPAQNLDMLELMYICLSLGFEGRYRVTHQGREKIEQIKDEIFTGIRRHRGDYERGLSRAWHGLGRTRNTLAQYLPAWVAASIIGAVLLVSYSGFRYWLYRSSAPVVSQLVEISGATDNVKAKSGK
jgi:type VI secretion system protein ImpK